MIYLFWALPVTTIVGMLLVLIVFLSSPRLLTLEQFTKKCREDRFVFNRAGWAEQGDKLEVITNTVVRTFEALEPCYYFVWLDVWDFESRVFPDNDVFVEMKK